ncbi:MAG: hypothetical protein K2M82_01335 [Lachnospiraceae bacterium]|nr:hypothetical protein [Lachnospiraceae bacterium]
MKIGVHNADYDPQPNPAEGLSRTQAKNIEKLNNLVNDHLKETDFSGTLRDLQGDPVPDGKGGYWNHLQEMLDTYRGLNKVYDALGRNLKNPNLSDSARTSLREAYQTAEEYLSMIEELFKPFGGVEAYE